MKPKLENPVPQGGVEAGEGAFSPTPNETSLYEKILKTIDSVNTIESNAAAIDTLYSELKNILKGIYFRANDIQAIEIYRDDEYIVIEFYLNTIEIWVKIYRDGYVDAHIRPILNCNCS